MKKSFHVLIATVCLIGSSALARPVTMIPLTSVTAELKKEECLARYAEEMAEVTDRFGYVFDLSETEERVGAPGSNVVRRVISVPNVAILNLSTGDKSPFAVGEVVYKSLVYASERPLCTIDISTPPIRQANHPGRR